MPETATTEQLPAKRSHRRADLAIGIALGLILGLAVVAAFVFLGSEGAVDAPHVSGAGADKAAHAAPSTPGRRAKTAAARQ